MDKELVMKLLSNVVITAILMSLFTACATTYVAPTLKSKAYTFEYKQSKDGINKLKLALVKSGFTISYADEQLISSNPKTMDLNENDADCGTTMGLDYLKDNRTSTTVSVNITKISDYLFEVKAEISGEYLKSDNNQSISMTCVSRGTIENGIINAIE